VEAAVKKLLLVSLVVLLAGCARKSTDDLLAEMRSGDATERLHAIRALEGRPAEAPAVVPSLAAALQDENTFVRRDAAVALGKMGPGAAAVPALRTARKDRHASVRKAAAEALHQIDPSAPAAAGGHG
jgi:HEAT repeat protein